MYQKKSHGWYKHKDFILLDLLCIFLAFIFAYYIRNHTYISITDNGVYRNAMILQTNITRNQYLKFIKLIRKVDFSDEDIIQLSGSDQEGEIHDEFYPDETELKKLIIQLFYEKV